MSDSSSETSSETSVTPRSTQQGKTVDHSSFIKHSNESSNLHPFAPSATTTTTTASANASRTYAREAGGGPANMSVVDVFGLVLLSSPVIGHFTGSSFITDLIGGILVVAYLWMLLGLPWSLYVSASKGRTTPGLAQWTWLAVSLAAPVLGVRCLSFILTALHSNPSHQSHALSSFNTSLFVLAAGVRPSKEIIRLLRDSDGKHEILKPSPSDSSDKASGEAHLTASALNFLESETAKALRTLKRRLDAIEQAQAESPDIDVDRLVETLASQTRLIRRLEAKVESLEREVIAVVTKQESTRLKGSHTVSSKTWWESIRQAAASSSPRLSELASSIASLTSASKHAVGSRQYTPATHFKPYALPSTRRRLDTIPESPSSESETETETRSNSHVWADDDSTLRSVSQNHREHSHTAGGPKDSRVHRAGSKSRETRRQAQTQPQNGHLQRRARPFASESLPGSSPVHADNPMRKAPHQRLFDGGISSTLVWIATRPIAVGFWCLFLPWRILFGLLGWLAGPQKPMF